jgi:hypothetical protein
MMLLALLRTHLQVASIQLRIWAGAPAQPAPGRAYFRAKGRALIALRWHALADAAGPGPSGSRWRAVAARQAGQALAELAAAGAAEGELHEALRSIATGGTAPAP